MITLIRLTTEAPPREGTGKWTIGYSIVIDSAEDMAAFATMVQRATNLWPDAPTSIKEFSDEISNGKHMQNYRFLSNEAQEHITDPKCDHVWHDFYKGTKIIKHVCDKCNSWRKV